ncbi:MAG: macro domain-containing protein [Bacteroidaceae bacterium]|nr:macro domain-containing protein [Bacteroidaceae bacterium]
MITYIKGDLLVDDAQALVNTVNTVGVMGKGIALQFKERYPENYNIYCKACKSGTFTPGQLLITECRRLGEEKMIINFPTKTTWRKPSEYSYIKSGLVALRSKIQELNIRSIAIPPLGSHNGGLDWSRVKMMIIEALGDLDCDIRIYEPSDVILERMKEERVKLTPARAMLLDVMCDMISFGEFASVFAAEKIVYFLQRLGARDIFKIDFVRGYYGPYSGGKISHVLYYLNGSYLKGMVGMQNKPFEEIWLLEDTAKYVATYLESPENKQYRDIADCTKKFLRGYYSSYSLELLSTIDYILHEEHCNSVDRESLVEYINENISLWNSRKQRIFMGSKFIPIVLEHLDKNHLI